MIQWEYNERSIQFKYLVISNKHFVYAINYAVHSVLNSLECGNASNFNS